MALTDKINDRLEAAGFRLRFSANQVRQAALADRRRQVLEKHRVYVYHREDQES